MSGPERLTFSDALDRLVAGDRIARYVVMRTAAEWVNGSAFMGGAP